MSNKERDFVVISGINGKEEYYGPSSELLCNACRCKLSYINEHDSDNGLAKWYCSRCNIFIYPSKDTVRRPSKFSTSGDKKDKMPLISTIENNDTKEVSSVYKKSKIPKSIEYLEESGRRITSYEEY